MTQYSKKNAGVEERSRKDGEAVQVGPALWAADCFDGHPVKMTLHLNQCSCWPGRGPRTELASVMLLWNERPSSMSR